MGKFCLTLWSFPGRRSLFVSGLVLWATLSNVGVLEAGAESNRAAASLHIQITVVPTVQTMTVDSKSIGSTAAVTYDLQSKTAPTLTQQTTTRSITPSDQYGTPTSASSKENQMPAVLETLTIIPK